MSDEQFKPVALEWEPIVVNMPPSVCGIFEAIAKCEDAMRPFYESRDRYFMAMTEREMLFDV